MGNKIGQKIANPVKPGRPKGAPNKTTAALKDAILNAFNSVGGESYLATIARDDPRTFCALLGKVLPLQIAGDENGGPVRLIVSTGVPRD
tara:strand:- start:5526 stop:5795 length:270 start_codon:yes stop_codon:yes gene_type:complete